MAETVPLAGVGLFARDESRTAVPLTGVSIHADLSGFCARVVVSQRYVNTESTPIEAVYVFPLDEGAAVCGFEAVVDGTLVVGELEEREKAFEKYDDAIAQGHGAFLLDEQRPDVFQASIGNLPPGKEVLVRLTYVTELSVDRTRARFMIPTTVSPRYAPAEDRTGVGQPDSEALNPPVDWRVPYGLDLSVRVRMPGRITTLESPSHPVSVSMDDSGATVTLAQGSVALDRDFVLSIDAEGLDRPQAWVERHEKGGEAVAVGFIPAFPGVSTSPAEIVFLVDRSGSMQGTSIQEVRNALQLCLRSMIPGCRFNVIGFGSTYEPLFPKSRAYDDASLREASEHVSQLRANLGGTEIFPALTFALEQTRDPSLPRHIVVLTDGEVSNTDAVIGLASKHAGSTRVFTFGIGAGASHHLVRGLARAGRGAAEFIYPGERIEKKVVGQFAKLLSPALADVRVEWAGGEVTQAPASVPPVFAGSRLLLYGFAKRQRPSAVRLSATSPSGPVGFDLPIDWSRVAAGSTVTTLAARARIRELEEGDEWLNARGSRQKERKETAARREIVDLSVRYSLISRETSFVAVERREMPVTGEMQLRKVPIALTSGWGGLDMGLHAFGFQPMKSMHMGTAALGRVFEWGEAGQELRAAPAQAIDRRLLEERLERRSREPLDREERREHERALGRPDGFDRLVSLQSADGSWELTRELAEVLGFQLAELERALADAAGDAMLARRAWATALALVWLQMHAEAREDEWIALGRKARKWLDVDATAPGGWTWIDAARRFLNPGKHLT
jgi:Ca-activated chloride channel family protein